MTFLWPGFLWAMPVALLLPVLYRWLLARRARPALRFSSLAPVRAALGSRWRRHVPPVLFWIACAALLVASARPVAPLTLPWTRPTIFLAIDTSLSMRVADVQPTRLAAAQAAAKAFLLDLPRGIDVGLVTFANGAQVSQRATADRAALAAAIDALQMQIGTAVGDAIVACLAELFPDQGLDLTAMTFGPRPALGRGASRDPSGGGTAAPAAGGRAASSSAFTPVAPGSDRSAAIILLSDGRRTAGVDTLVAARLAAERGVRIDVIGLGTLDGAVPAGEGLAIYMKLDEPTLREVARSTGGEYHRAGTAEDLRSVYARLGARTQVQTRETELAPVLAAAAGVLVLVGAGLSFRWFGGPVGGSEAGAAERPPTTGPRRRAAG